MMCRLVASVVGIIAITALSTSASADYIPDSYLPSITGQAAAPVNIPIKYSDMHPVRNPDGTYSAAKGDVFTFAMTGKDMDTWKDTQGGAAKEFFDQALECRKGNEQYPIASGPTLRGFASDGTATWDLVGYGVLIPNGTPAGVSQSRTYINSYELYNVTTSGRAILLNDPSSYISQTLLQPAL